MFENLDNNDRCSVTAYLAYKQHRPPEMMADDSPFYLAIKAEVPRAGKEMVQGSSTGSKFTQICSTSLQYYPGGESSTSVATSSSPKVTVDEITSVSTVQPSTSAGTLPFLYQCQVGTVNIFTNSQNPKGSDFEKTHQFKRRRIVIDSSDESQ